MLKIRDLTVPEINKCIELCNFIDDELQLFKLKSHSYAMRDRDNDGRYSEDNFRYSQDRGRSYAYGRASSRDSLVDKLEYMAQSAVDEHERRVLMDCANKLK